MCMRARAAILVLVVAALMAMELPVVNDVQFQLEHLRRICRRPAKADEQPAFSSEASAMTSF